jgi:CBS domain-containing protein
MIRDAKAEEEGRLEHVSTAIEEVMTTDVMTTEPEASLAQCAQTLIAYRISSMPVIENGAPVGLLTQRHIIEYYSHLI